MRALPGPVKVHFNTVGIDAVIVDSGLPSGIEKHCHRRNLKQLGVCPEALTNLKDDPEVEGTISQNHTHVFLTEHQTWEEVFSLKFALCKRYFFKESLSQGGRF